MRPVYKRVLLWAPRVLGILFALLVAVSALDVFGMGYGFWETIGALLIHLIPVYLLLIAVAVGWRWEWAGGLLFVALGLLYLASFWGRFPWGVYALMTGVPVLVGLLFLAGWLVRPESHTSI